MKITFLGHAGLFIETKHGSILCDPWFNAEYLASWFPFPDNSDFDVSRIAKPDYLYVSHEHRDHLDQKFLRENVSKGTTVLLPDYALDSLQNHLSSLGFHRFQPTVNGEVLDLGGLKISIHALVSPSDGPEGDSAITVDDGEVRIFNQNDARPVELEKLLSIGPFDAHFLQYSGAIWYPMVYRMDHAEKQRLIRQKVQNQNRRALDYIRSVGARYVFPSAGPPCFLDDELFALNDLADNETIFADQRKFLAFLERSGFNDAQEIVPGSLIDIDARSMSVQHPIDQDTLNDIFENKEAYLRAYAERERDQITAFKEGLPEAQHDLLPAMRERFVPLLNTAPHTCRAVADRIMFDTGREQIVIDFVNRSVEAAAGLSCSHVFHVEANLLKHCLSNEVDWVNSLFLSCRFEARRVGPYNEYLYNFFKCLSPERLAYAEGYYANEKPEAETFELGGYKIPTRCPHLGADLRRFGSVKDGILTCSMHGFRFDLKTGKCLTSPHYPLRTDQSDVVTKKGD